MQTHLCSLSGFWFGGRESLSLHVIVLLPSAPSAPGMSAAHCSLRDSLGYPLSHCPAWCPSSLCSSVWNAVPAGRPAAGPLSGIASSLADHSFRPCVIPS